MSKVSNTKGTISQAESIWPTFDAESSQSRGLPKGEENPDFVSFSKEGNNIPEFTPLEESRRERVMRKKAEDILKEAESRRAFLEKEAYEKGFAQGEKDGFELGQRKIVKSIENIEKLFIEFGNLKKEILKKFEKEILELVVSICQKIIHKKIDEDDKIIKAVVIEAMHSVTDKSQIVVKVNPGDYDTIENLKPEFFKTFKDLKSIKVTADQSVTRGGCLLGTLYGDIDASVEARMDRIQQSLLRAFLVKGEE